MNAKQTFVAVIIVVLMGEYFAEIFAKYGTLIIETVLALYGVSLFFRLRKSRK